MQIVVNEIFNHPILTRGKKQINPYVISGNSLEECYTQIYKLEKSARYNNYKWYEFIDLDTEKLYQEWKKDGVTIDLFYGNATVD
jgi:hypothetical protein